MMIFHFAADTYDIGAPLIRLLIIALGRKPGKFELQALVTRYRGGEDLARIVDSIAGSTEFAARHGPSGPADAHYLRSLYWEIDGQDPAPEDAALLIPPASRAGVLLAVSQSSRALSGISLIESLYPDGLPPEDDVAYQLWLDTIRDTPADIVSQVQHAATLPVVLFSLILPVPAVRPDLVEETVASLGRQIWPHWECLLVCPATLPPHVHATVKALASRVAAVRMIEVPVLSPADGVNLALKEASGVMVGWLEASDRLAPTALYEAAAVLAVRPALRLIYTDEDYIAGDGTRHDPALKSGWSPDLALTGDSLGQMTLFNRQDVVALGGFSAEAAPFERYELGLRLANKAAPDSVHHIPAILFHRGRQRAGRPARFPEARAIASEPRLMAVVDRHLQRNHPGLTLGERLQGNSVWPCLFAALQTPAPRVTVIIPIRDQAELLERCVEGLLTKTNYPDIEVLVVDNASREAETLALLQRIQHDKRVRVLSRPGVFNWSALNNAAAAEATGEILLLLNNDIEVVEPDWLTKLAGHVLRPDVGIVGARLLFPNKALQHGGVLLGPKGRAVHAMTYAAEGDAGYLGQVALPRDLSAVTGACLAIRRTVFEEVGGLDATAFRVGWSDIDLCLRVRRDDYRVLWLPDVVLTHREMATRGRDVTTTQQARHEIERAALRMRWPVETDLDPFLNPNLEATATAVVLATPPRRRLPWPYNQEEAE